ncbi:MAG: hypothetical protein WC869_08600 [Phycisphaerae bacterium]|jgi:hypothetical protein
MSEKRIRLSMLVPLLPQRGHRSARDYNRFPFYCKSEKVICRQLSDVVAGIGLEK